MRGQDLNLRPSGYEAAIETANDLESQAIVAIVLADSGEAPLRNPAIPGGAERADDASDDSVDLDHVRALAVAASALLVVEPQRARVLLTDLIRLLDAHRAPPVGDLP